MALKGDRMPLYLRFPTWCMKKAQTVVSDPFLFPSFLQTRLSFSENRTFLTVTKAFLFKGAMHQNLHMEESPNRSSTSLL